MNKIIAQYTTYDGNDRADILIQKIGQSTVVTIDYTMEIDQVREAYYKSRNKKERKELKQQYITLAEQYNAQYGNIYHTRLN